MLLSFFSERERLKTGDTNVVKVSFPKREGLKTGNAWAIQMLLSCFSERERLKTGNFSFVGVRTCQCMTKTFFVFTLKH